MSDKNFKTIDEQIDLLAKRGLSIPNKKQARDFLLRNNYYRISGYSLTLRSHDVFNVGASLQNVIDIYSFDYELRHVLLRYIETIEVAVKSTYAYEFTMRYGATGYLCSGHFVDADKHKEIIGKAEAQKMRRFPHEPWIKHFVEDLQQDIPLWAYVELLTISDISFLYSISQKDIQEAVAASLGICCSGAKLLKKFMHSMTIVRNLCAHGSRLYNRLFSQKPRLSKDERDILIKDRHGRIDDAHLFSFVIVMRRLLTREEFTSMKDEIRSLSQKYSFVDIKHYGFPSNWDSVL